MTIARINPNNGQLCSLTSNGVETMWHGGEPDAAVPADEWENSTLVMVPFSGRAPNDKILVKGKPTIMTQHGLSRWSDQIPWKVVESDSSKVVIEQVYDANRKIRSKKNSAGEVLLSEFPWSFRVTVAYRVDSEGDVHYELQITNLSDEPMPIAPGLHPAFRSVASGIIKVFENGRQKEELTLEDIAKDSAIDVGDSERVDYSNLEFAVRISHDFGQMRVWRSKGGGLIAFEPVVTNRAPEEDKELGSQPGFMNVEKGKTESFEAVIRIRT
jgi:galactose mutarotase-like enzyme